MKGKSYGRLHCYNVLRFPNSLLGNPYAAAIMLLWWLKLAIVLCAVIVFYIVPNNHPFNLRQITFFKDFSCYYLKSGLDCSSVESRSNTYCMMFEIYWANILECNKNATFKSAFSSTWTTWGYFLKYILCSCTMSKMYTICRKYVLIAIFILTFHNNVRNF